MDVVFADGPVLPLFRAICVIPYSRDYWSDTYISDSFHRAYQSASLYDMLYTISPLYEMYCCVTCYTLHIVYHVA